MGLKLIFLTFIASLMLTSLLSDEIILKIPILEDSPNQHQFFHELLVTAMKHDGHDITLQEVTLPQLRIKNYLELGEISIYWMIESEKRNEKFEPIKVQLTNGMIGKRILLIGKENQSKYNNVKNLDDFRNLNTIAAMGENWFDNKVWEKNGLKYHTESGNWKDIFRVLALGRYDYFPRGLNEILIEAQQYPDLSIEEKIVLIYDRDYIFYLSKNGNNPGSKNKGIIERSLNKAKKDGVIDSLIEKYWGENFKQLDYDNRVKLYLKLP